ncbi:unnamed protein product, partial [Darwinula stevensoni]
MNGIRNGTGRVDIHRWKSADLVRLYHLCLESLIEEDEEQIRGISHVIDMREASLPYLMLWTPVQFQRAISHGERFLPMRHKRVDLFNPPMGTWIIYEFCKHCFSEKIRSRMKVR